MNTEYDSRLSEERTADEGTDRFRQAIDDFRAAESAVPGWAETERLILGGMTGRPAARNGHGFAMPFSLRKAAMVGAFSFIILTAFFAVPFSQTTEIGARLVFELTRPDNRLEDVDFAGIVEDPALGIDNYNISIRLNGSSGPMAVELLLLSKNPGAPGAVLSALTAEYPALDEAEATISPVTESTSGSLFSRLAGELKVRVNCAGMTTEEIEKQVGLAMAAQGAEGLSVDVSESGEGRQRRLMIRINGDAGETPTR